MYNSVVNSNILGAIACGIFATAKGAYSITLRSASWCAVTLLLETLAERRFWAILLNAKLKIPKGRVAFHNYPHKWKWKSVGPGALFPRFPLSVLIPIYRVYQKSCHLGFCLLSKLPIIVESSCVKLTIMPVIWFALNVLDMGLCFYSLEEMA